MIVSNIIDCNLSLNCFNRDDGRDRLTDCTIAVGNGIGNGVGARRIDVYRAGYVGSSQRNRTIISIGCHNVCQRVKRAPLFDSDCSWSGDDRLGIGTGQPQMQILGNLIDEFARIAAFKTFRRDQLHAVMSVKRQDIAGIKLDCSRTGSFSNVAIEDLLVGLIAIGVSHGHRNVGISAIVGIWLAIGKGCQKRAIVIQIAIGGK